MRGTSKAVHCVHAGDANEALYYVHAGCNNEVVHSA